MKFYTSFIKLFYTLIFSLACVTWVTGQLSDLSIPPGMSYKKQKGTLVTFPMPDVKVLLEEDKIDTGAWRFGVEIPCHDDLSSFEKTTISEGVLYNMRITITGAKSINLNFDEFYLLPGSKMWIYSADREYKMGAFTYRNVNKHGNFAVLPLPVDDIIIEVLEPLENINTSKLKLSGVVAGYKDFLPDKGGYGQSGACNVNINCPQGAGWADQRQATLMLLTSNNTRKCTGMLINNTSNDGTPYVLTANHCNTATNAIFMFNYQSPNCTNVDGPTDMVLQGCEIIAQNSFSDFSLLKLDQTPLPDFNPFYGGWDRSPVPASMAWCIHHPSGDIKKISIDSNAVVSSGYVSQPDSYNNHWKVLDWDLGTTEGGSSGSPLFNPQHRFVGQLHGGYASCTNNLSDYYGRFDISWHYGTTPTERLSEWLDPLGKDSMAIEGNYIYTPAFQTDLAVKDIYSLPKMVCDSAISPKVSFISYGSDTVITFHIEYGVEAPYATYDWTGNIGFMQTATINLPEVVLPDDTNYVFWVKILSVNNAPDNNPNNDTKQKFFKRIIGTAYQLVFTTDAKAYENTIEITMFNGNPVFYEDNFTSNTTHSYNFCLTPDCYHVTFTDAGSDGICCDYGNGLIVIKEESGKLVCKVHNFADTLTFDFCNPSYYFGDELANAYPNPSWGDFQLILHPDIVYHPLELLLIDIHGKVAHQEKIQGSYSHLISTFGLGRGIYTLYLYDWTTGKSWRKKMIVLNDLQ